MTRTRLRFLKEPTPMNRLAHKKQRSCRVSSICENKKQCYGSLNVNCITDNKNVWRVVKPNFSNKIVDTNRVILRYDGKIISDTNKVAYTFNRFFVNIGKTLKIAKDKRFLVETTMYFILFHRQLKNVALMLAFLALKKR